MLDRVDLKAGQTPTEADWESWFNRAIDYINAGIPAADIVKDAGGRVVVNITGDATSVGGKTVDQIVAGDFPDVKKTLIDLIGGGLVLNGGVATKNGTTPTQLDITAATVVMKDTSTGYINRVELPDMSKTVTLANTTYYLDVAKGATDYSWGTAHSVGDYVTLATVVTDASANITSVIDTRPLTANLFGGFDAQAVLPALTTHLADMSKHIPYAVTAHTGNAYSVTVSGVDVLTDGCPLCIKFDAASTGAITVNPNGLGAKSVVDYFGNAVTNVRSGLIANLRYDATSGNFILQGKGGGGNATAGDLLSGKTASVDTGQLTGTMPNKVGSATVITPSTADQAIPQGYYGGANSDGKVAGDANLIPANILSGKTIFGVAGTAIEGKRWATDDTPNTHPNILAALNIRGLAFTPSVVLAYSSAYQVVIAYRKNIVNVWYDYNSSSTTARGLVNVSEYTDGILLEMTNNDANPGTYTFSWIAIE